MYDGSPSPTPEPHSHDSSWLPALLVGLAVVTLALGLVALWLASGARRDAAALNAANQALATAQAEAAAQAALRVQAQGAEATAIAQAEAAQRQTVTLSRVVRASQLANNASLALDGKPQAALLLAVEAVRVQREAGEAPLPEVLQRLRSILGITGGMPLATGDAIVSALAAAHDGAWAAAGDEQGNIRLWNLNALDKAPRVLAGRVGPVWALAFSADNTALVSAGDDGTVRIWPTASAAPPTVLNPHAGPLYALAVQPGGAVVAAAGDDGVVRLWDLRSPTAPPQALAGHTAVVNALAFSPDGATLASAGDDATPRLWDVAAGRLLATLSTGPSPAAGGTRAMPTDMVTATQSVSATAAVSPTVTPAATPAASPAASPNEQEPASPDTTNTTATGSLVTLAFSPDGHYLAAGSDDSKIWLWGGSGAARLQPAGRLLNIGELAVYALRFSPDGQWLASGDDNGGVRLWNTANPTENYLLGRHQGNVRGLDFVATDAGLALASSGYDGQVRLWNYVNREAPPVILRGHDGAINLLVGIHVGSSLPDRLLTAGYDHSLRLWQATRPFAEPNAVILAEQPVGKVVVSPDGKRIIAALADAPIIQSWDSSTGAPLQRIALDGETVAALAVSADGGRLWAGGKNGSLWGWEGDAITPTYQITGPVGSINAVAEAADGSLLAAAGDDGVIRLWQRGAATPLRQLDAQGGAISGLAFAQDGKTLAASNQDGMLRLWDVASGQLRNTLRGPDLGLLDVALQPAGAWIVGAGADGALWVWNADALDFEPAQLRRHRNEVNAVSFSADGSLLASAGADGAVYLWNTAQPSAEPDTLLGHDAAVNGIAFAPDGSWAVTASADGTLRRWALTVDALIDEACRTAGRNFTLDEWTQFFPTDVSRYRKTCTLLPDPLADAAEAAGAVGAAGATAKATP